MGVASRYYIVDDDGAIRKIAATKFARVAIPDSDERMPEYADKRVRYAAVYVDVVERTPVGLRTVDFGYLLFDKEGRFDHSEWDSAVLTAMNSWGLPSGERPPNVTDARRTFARQRIKHEHQWEPSDDLLQEILRLAFARR